MLVAACNAWKSSRRYAWWLFDPPARITTASVSDARSRRPSRGVQQSGQTVTLGGGQRTDIGQRFTHVLLDPSGTQITTCLDQLGVVGGTATGQGTDTAGQVSDTRVMRWHGSQPPQGRGNPAPAGERCSEGNAPGVRPLGRDQRYTLRSLSRSHTLTQGPAVIRNRNLLHANRLQFHQVS